MISAGSITLSSPDGFGASASSATAANNNNNNTQMEEQEFKNRLVVLSDLAAQVLENVSVGTSASSGASASSAGSLTAATELEKALVCVAMYWYEHQSEYANVTSGKKLMDIGGWLWNEAVSSFGLRKLDERLKFKAFGSGLNTTDFSKARVGSMICRGLTYSNGSDTSEWLVVVNVNGDEIDCIDFGKDHAYSWIETAADGTKTRHYSRALRFNISEFRSVKNGGYTYEDRLFNYDLYSGIGSDEILNNYDAAQQDFSYPNVAELKYDENGNPLIPQSVDAAIASVAAESGVSRDKNNYDTDYYRTLQPDITINLRPQSVAFTGYKGVNCFTGKSSISSDEVDADVVQSEDCPAGQVKDANGNCVPNAIPSSAQCCAYTTAVPSTPQEMLPISTLSYQKHTLDGLAEDVFADVFGTNDLGLGAQRERNTHGMAMGLLNPLLDSGKSTKFGFFRGERILGYEQGTGNPRYNTFLIGCAWNVDFLSVLANGLAGNVTLTNDDGSQSTKSPGQWAYDLVSTDYKDDTDENYKNRKVTKWLHSQEANGSFELVTFRTENNGLNVAYNTLLKGAQNTRAVWMNRSFVATDVNSGFNSRLEAEIRKNKENTNANSTRGTGEEQFAGTNGNSNHNIRGKEFEDGLFELLALLDNNYDFSGKICVICLDRAMEKDSSAMLKDFLLVAQTAINVATSMLPVVGTLVGSATTKVLNTVFKVVEAGLNFVQPIANIVEGNANLATTMNMAISIYQMANVLDAPSKYDSATNTASDGAFGLNKIVGSAATKWTQIQGYINNLKAAYPTAFAAFNSQAVGGNVATMLGMVDVYKTLNSQGAVEFIANVGGFKQADVSQYLSYLKNGMSNALQVSVRPPYYNNPLTDDLNKCIKDWEQIKSVALGDALSNFFSGDGVMRNVQNLLINQNTNGSNFLSNPLIRGALLKLGGGGQIGTLPKLESVIGAAFSVNSAGISGSGIQYAINNIGRDGFMGMVKAATGFPTTSKEVVELLKQGTLLEAGIDPLVGPINDDDKVILDSSMNGDLKECIACSFEKSGIRTQRCEDGQIYNWLTGKCIRPMFSGLVPKDCYNPCEHLTQITNVPAGLKECNGRYYLDTQYCGTAKAVATALDTAVEAVHQIAESHNV